MKIIRLVARNTVEEIILKRADEKLKLTNSVLEGGQVRVYTPHQYVTCSVPNRPHDYSVFRSLCVFMLALGPFSQ